MTKQKKKIKDSTKICNICDEKLNKIILYMCPNCSSTGDSTICYNCDSEMKEVELLSCPSCGNTIDEATLEEKRKLKERFNKL